MQKPSPRILALASARIRVLAEAWQRGEPDYTPWQAPCVCGCGIHAHTGKNRKGKCTACRACRSYRADRVDQLVQEILAGATTPFTDLLRAQHDAEHAARRRPERGPGEWSVRPSDLGKCVKQLWYRNDLAGPDYVPEPTGDGAALAGRIVEEAVTRINRRAYPWREYQRQVDVKGLSSVGYIDELDLPLGMPREIKSCGDWKWDHVQTWGPIPEEVGQLLLYADALEREGLWVNVLQMHYIHRDNFEEIVFTIPWDDTARALVEQHRDTLIGYQTTLDVAAETGEPPEREGSGPDRYPCKWCEAKGHCWNIAAARAQGRSPESLTILGELDPVKITWVCEQIIEARRVRDEAEASYQAKNALIDHSVEPGEYGIARVERGRRGGILHARYAEALCRQIEILGGDPHDVRIPKGGPGKPVVKLISTKKRQPETVPAPTPPPEEVEP